MSISEELCTVWEQVADHYWCYSFKSPKRTLYFSHVSASMGTLHNIYSSNKANLVLIYVFLAYE